VNLKVDGAATGAGQESERRRFLVLDVFNGVSRGPLRVHLYDEGKDGYRLAGLERPLSAAAPAFSETP
jgi:hypothetical protein